MNITVQDIDNLLLIGESPTFEVKSANKGVPKNFWETYSAFANTHGGIIILGITDAPKFEVIGIENPQKYIDDIISTARSAKVSQDLFKSPDSVISLEYNSKTIIVCEIPEAPFDKKPIFLNNSIENSYVRKGTGDHRISRDELSSILRDTNHELDRKLLDNFTIDDLDMSSILKYKTILHNRAPSRQFDTQDIYTFLNNLDVFVLDRTDGKPKLTLAGLLFFGKLTSIKSYIPAYHVDYFDKRGSTDRWRDRVDSEDLEFENLNLFNYYEIIMEKLKISIDRNFDLDNQTTRKSPSDLLIALREAFVNMIVHADYLSNQPSLIVEVHNPYYTFLNPGKMKITKEEFFCGSRSVSRNPTLMSLFTKMGAAERAGSGSQKIIDVVKRNDFRYPEIDSTIEETKLKLWVAHLIDSLDLPEIEKNIYIVISNSPTFSCTKKHISEKLPQYTDSQIRDALERLYTQKLISKLGGNRNRTYARNVSELELIKALEMVTEHAKNHFKSITKK
ncbi:MAG: hypothetical protein E7204_00860 [Veillonella sp.]|uniref:RNA-binding domain-containing protein n=1 Tax=Veillonella sp. TaxID=1926307 RepID=UPI0025FC7596|nr:RNA-binding domain-containing protein [Veillonella sp.]MBE6079397.1 hypothetical protein [Veillonella sp.]